MLNDTVFTILFILRFLIILEKKCKKTKYVHLILLAEGTYL